jgi:hypothetical protein
MKKLEYIQIKSEINRKKVQEKAFMFRIGILFIAIGMILHLTLETLVTTGYAVGLGMILLVLSNFNSLYLRKRMRKLKELEKEGISAEDAISQILNIEEDMLGKLINTED